MTTEPIKHSAYVTNYDPTLKHHRAFFQGVLDALAKHDPATLQEGGKLRKLWQSGPAPITTTANLFDRLKPLLDLIASGEGGYTSINRGCAGDTPEGFPGLTEMTIAQVQIKQSLAWNAVGRYQFIPSTLKIALEAAQITPVTEFAPEVQDWLAIALLIGGKRPKLRDYLLGKDVSLDEAQTDLALEWASIPLPNGRGAYDGDSAGNRAHTKVGKTRAALENARKALAGIDRPVLTLPAKQLTPLPQPQKKILPHLRLTQTTRRDGSLVMLCLERVKDGIPMDELLVVSGGPRNQFFRRGKDSKAKSMEPLPEGVYSVGQIEFKNGKDNYAGTWGEGLGPVWIGIEYIRPGKTERSALGIHLDENVSYAPGTAACIGIRSIDDLKKLVRWLRMDDPQTLLVDWGLGTCPKTP